MPTLDLQPEPIEALRKRYPAALAKVWDTEVIAAGDKSFADRPGSHREHVFDFREDGEIVRLIVSVERFQDETVLHVSQSHTGGPKFIPLSLALAKAMRQWASIARPHPPTVQAKSWSHTEKVVHLILPWPLTANGDH